MPTDVLTHRPGLDLAWRAALPAAALLALAVGAPQPVTGGLALAGLAASAHLLAGARGHGTTDRVLVGVGGVVVAVVLTGMLLGATPVGLRPGTWVVSLAAVSLLGLAVRTALPHREVGVPAVAATERRTLARTTPWVVAAVAVAAVSVGMSAASLERADQPPVAMSFGQVSGTQVQVVVTAGDDVGPLEVRTSDDAADGGGAEISYPLVSVTAGETTTTTVSLPTSGRFVITLSRPDQTQPLRTLVLDR